MKKLFIDSNKLDSLVIIQNVNSRTIRSISISYIEWRQKHLCLFKYFFLNHAMFFLLHNFLMTIYMKALKRLDCTGRLLFAILSSYEKPKYKNTCLTDCNCDGTGPSADRKVLTRCCRQIPWIPTTFGRLFIQATRLRISEVRTRINSSQTRWNSAVT